MSFMSGMGALKGLGEGITEGAEVGIKNKQMERQNQLQTDRETMIQKMQQEFQGSESSKQRTFQEQQTEREITGRSGVAHFEQEQENTRAAAERASKEAIASSHETAATERAGITSSGRIVAAGERSGGAGGGKGGDRPDFTLSHIQVAPRDSAGKPIPGAAPETHIVAVHKNGSQYMQVGGTVDPQTGMPQGGKMVLFDAQRNQPVDLSTRPRPNAGAISDLIQNPNTDHAMAFQQRYGYLPSEYFGAAHAQAQSSSQNQGAPKLPVFNYFGKGAQVTHTIPVGGSPGGDQGTGSGPSGGSSDEPDENQDSAAVEDGPPAP